MGHGQTGYRLCPAHTECISSGNVRIQDFILERYSWQKRSILRWRRGSWAPRITSDLIVADSIALSDVFLDQTLIYWIEGRPKEGGRYVLVGQSIADASAKPHDLIPKEFNARTRVHEYGGRGGVD